MSNNFLGLCGLPYDSAIIIRHILACFEAVVRCKNNYVHAATLFPPLGASLSVSETSAH
jgi:hypothetical protein